MKGIQPYSLLQAKPKTPKKPKLPKPPYPPETLNLPALRAGLQVKPLNDRNPLNP